jgi:hypothetical protein
MMIDGERRMTRIEMLDEARWLLEGQVSALQLPALLGFTWAAIDMAGRRLGYPDVSRAVREAFNGAENWKRIKADPERMKRNLDRRREQYRRGKSGQGLAA